MVIAIDFDGTCTTHEYPYVGRDIGAAPVLKELIQNGHKLMLWTMRGNKPIQNGKDTLKDAVNWFNKNEIPLWGINQNPDQALEGWTNSNKQHANLYIDDAALGCPLIYPTNGERPYVDWTEVRKILIKNKIIK